MTEAILQEDSNHFDDAFDRIKKSTGMRTQVEIAKMLDIRQSSISDAKRRQSIPDSWLIKLYQIYNLNPNWIIDSAAAPCRSGKPAMFTGASPGTTRCP